jgi:hypothetical protein
MATRREFITKAGTLSAAFLGLQRISFADLSESAASMPTCLGYGKLVPDPARIFDLPKGFHYRVIAQAG